jgi:SEC-C motif-containing protein
MNTLCPCGSNNPIDICCLPIIKELKEAETAEQLMRSRYTAFTLTEVDYLMKSHHPKTRNIKQKKKLKKWAQSVSWVGLSILSKDKGNINDVTGTVEFRAVFVKSGKPELIHERSAFVKENNKWFYVDGEFME